MLIVVIFYYRHADARILTALLIGLMNRVDDQLSNLKVPLALEEEGLPPWTTSSDSPTFSSTKSSGTIPLYFFRQNLTAR